MSPSLDAVHARRALMGSALALALNLPVVSVFAQPASLTPVVVTGSREPEPLDRIAADVVVIDAERIRASSADSVEDLLRREAGLQVSRNGPPGQNASVFIRGANTTATVVLIDGVRIGAATVGSAELESIGLAQIERIEVLRGPASSLYGADAVGGVVQIFTRRGSGDPRVAAHSAVGGYSALAGDLQVSGSSGAFDYAASLGHEQNRGVSAVRPGDLYGNYNPDADGFRRETAQARLGYAPTDGQRIGVDLVSSRLRSQFDSSEYLPPAYAADATPDFRNRLRSEIAALDYRGTLTPEWTTSAQLSRGIDDLRSGGHLIDRYRTRRDQLTWQNAWKPNPDQQVVLAYEHLSEKAASTAYADDHRRSNDGLVFGYSGRFGAQSVQADLRRDRNSVYGGQTTGRLGWSAAPAPGWRVRALGGTSFRAPGFNELYYPGYGVAGVTPERGRSIEAGLEWRGGAAEVSATVYRNRVRDLIAYETDVGFCPAEPAYQYGCARNIGRARLQGATLAAKRRWEGWRIAATVDLLDAKDEATGTRLARRAAHQATVNVDRDLGAWRLGAALLEVGARPDNGARLGSYATLDLQAGWQWAPRWQLELKLLNATDRRYEPARDYQPLGRQGWIGVRYRSRDS